MIARACKRAFTRSGLVAVGLVLAGCGVPSQVSLPARVDPQGLTAEQVQALDRAADDWYVASAGTFDLIAQAGEPLPVSAGLDDGEAAGETVFAANEPIRIGVNVPMIDRAPQVDRWQFVFEHELGHALGLDHRALSLMEPRQREARACVDAGSLALACANYGGCNAGFHSTCED